MITIRSVEDVFSLVELALEIQEVETLRWKDAVREAIRLMPRLRCEVENNLLYWPAECEPAIAGGNAPEVHTSWSIPPRDVVVELPAVRHVEAA